MGLIAFLLRTFLKICLGAQIYTPSPLVCIYVLMTAVVPAVVDGMMHCDVSLEADRDRHQDGAGHGHHQQRVQEVRKENNVLKSKLEIIPNIVYFGKYLSNLVSHGLLKE